MFEETYAHMEMYGSYPLLQSVYRKYSSTDTALLKVHNDIPENSENKPRGLYFSKALIEGPIFGGAYIRRGLSTEGDLRFKIDWASPIVGSKFTVFALFYHVFESNCPSTNPRGAIFGGAI